MMDVYYFRNDDDGGGGDADSADSNRSDNYLLLQSNHLHLNSL